MQCKRPWFDSWVGKIPRRTDRLPTPVFLGFPGGSVGKESACNVGDLGSIPGLERSSGGGHGNPLQCSCLENPLDGGACWAAVYEAAQSQTQLKQLSSSSSSSIYLHFVESMEFSRPEYWSGPFPSPGDLPNPGIEPRSPTLWADSLPAEPPGKPKNTGVGSLFLLHQIFPTQESNWDLLHCRWILYQLSYQGSPY